jgi:hypothetical protein
MRLLLGTTILMAAITTACQAATPDGPPATTTARSPSSADIQASIDVARNGDTVTVPAGNATWTSNVTIPADKGIRLIGAGVGNTNITLGGHRLTLQTREANAPVRVSGFRFIDGPGYALTINSRDTGAKNWRIDHCEWVDNAPIALFVSGYTWGVIDNCNFPNIERAIFIEFRCDGQDYGVPGDYSWAQPITMGGPDAIYIEDCYFNNTISYPGQVIDTRAGGRYVFRHNTVRGWMGVETHSGCTPGFRNPRWVEIYENDFDVSPASRWLAIWFRATNGVCFNNTFKGNYTDPIQFDYEMACPRPEACATPWPAAGTMTYPAQDQIGVGRSTRGWGSSQALDEAKLWIWGNTHDGRPTAPLFTSCDASADLIQFGRDYFLSAPPNYAPYAYPHPLRNN